MIRMQIALLAAALSACVGDGAPTADEDGGGGKADRASSTLFSDGGPDKLVVQGPLQTAFDAARAGEPDGIFPQPRVTDPFMGKIGYADVLLDAELEVRGNSSLAECPFPKLKAKADKVQAAGTPFDGARKLKI